MVEVLAVRVRPAAANDHDVQVIAEEPSVSVFACVEEKSVKLPTLIAKLAEATVPFCILKSFVEVSASANESVPVYAVVVPSAAPIVSALVVNEQLLEPSKYKPFVAPVTAIAAINTTLPDTFKLYDVNASVGVFVAPVQSMLRQFAVASTVSTCEAAVNELALQTTGFVEAGTLAPETPPSAADHVFTVFQLAAVPRVRLSVQFPAPLDVMVFAPATRAFGLSVIVAVPDVIVPVQPDPRVIVNVPAPPVVDKVSTVSPAVATLPVTSLVITAPSVMNA
jgi:hypothetical protein